MYLIKSVTLPEDVTIAAVEPPPKPAAWLYGNPRIVDAVFSGIKPLLARLCIKLLRIVSEGNVPNPS